MDELIKLAIYAAIAAAAYIAFDHYILGPAERRGAANQMVADQKVVKQLTDQRDDARKQSTDALADVDACKASLMAQGRRRGIAPGGGNRDCALPSHRGRATGERSDLRAEAQCRRQAATRCS